MWPKRQIASAITQVATNIPTIRNPSTLRSMPSNQFQNAPDRSRWLGDQPAQLDVPMTSATATDRPVIVRL